MIGRPISRAEAEVMQAAQNLDIMLAIFPKVNKTAAVERAQEIAQITLKSYPEAVQQVIDEITAGETFQGGPEP